MAAKSGNVMARVEPEINEQAENILSTLGISASGVINMLYRQIILTNGVPFSMTIPRALPTVDSMTRDEFDAMLEKGYGQAKAGQGLPLEDAFAILSHKV